MMGAKTKRWRKPSLSLFVLMLLNGSALNVASAFQLESPAQPVTSPSEPLYAGSQPDWFGFSSPVRVRVHGGETYAEPGEFVSFNMLKPLKNARFNDGSQQLFYLDARGALNFEQGQLANLGLGHRHYFAQSDMIVDGNVWYDADNTRNRLFHQFTAGGQIQNRNLLVRGHYYLPVGDTKQSVGYTPYTGNSVYAGNTLALERYRLEQQAFQGFDAEIGLMWSVYNTMNQVLVGYYDFRADNAENISGVSGTLGTSLGPSFSLQVQVTHDDQSDTAAMLTATYEFFNAEMDRSKDIRYRLGESARRNYHTVARTTQVYDPKAATDASGNEFSFIHVSSTGAGAGTFESPYANLSLAATDAAATPESIIIAHGGSVFDGQDIILPTNTRFLGEGVDHLVVTSEVGSHVLPSATGSSVTPIIRNSPGAAITLGADTEVSGFAIENAGAAGLFADGLTGTALVSNTTVDGAVTGLHLVNNAGTITLDNVNFTNTTGSGVHLETATATSAVTFQNALSISNSGLYGLHLDRGAVGSATIFNGATTVTNSTGHGIFLDDNEKGATATFNGATTVDGSGDSGVVVSDVTPAFAFDTDVAFVGPLTINNTVNSGFVATDNASNISIQALQITNWNQSAIVLDNNDAEFSVVGPLVLDNVNGSLASTIQINNVLRAASFGDVTITDTARAAGGTATVNLFDNDTSVWDITFNSLNIDTVNGIGLRAQDVGAGVSDLVIGGGTITSDGGTAVYLENLATDITFQSVSAANTAVGIQLVELGQVSAFHNGFRVVGTTGVPGSGGVMTNVQQGIVIDSSDSVTLQNMSIDSSVAGVFATSNGTNEPDNLLIDNMLFTDTGNNANWVGIDIAWNNGAHFSNPTTISNNTFTSAGATQTAIRVANNDAFPALELGINGNVVNLSGAGATGISLLADGISVGQVIDAGHINLTPGTNNVVNFGATPITATEVNGGVISGQIRVNGVLFP